MSPVRWMVVLLLALVPMSACGGDEDTVPASTGPVEDTAATGPTEATDPLEGTWTTVITPELEKQAAVAAGIEPELTSNEDLFGGSGPITIVLTFGNGQMIHTAAPEGAGPEVGWSGRYEIVDDDTFIAGDAEELYIEYRYAIDGDQLVIDLVRDDFPTVSEDELAGEIYAQTVIYESASFTRES